MAAALVACWLQVVAETLGGDRVLELPFEGVVVEAVGGVEGVAIDRVQFLQGSAVSGFALFARGEAVVTPAVVEAGIAVVGRALGRAEERRVGKECVHTCRSGWAPAQ